MKNNGCMDCKHNLGVEKGCSKEFNEEQINWWKNNGLKKINSDSFDSMSCFENNVLTTAYDINLSLESLLEDLSLK